MNFQRAFDNLKAMSVSQTDYLKEWQFLLKYEDKSKCLCGKALKHCNIFTNKLNGKEVILGDGCLTLLRKKKTFRELPDDDNLDDDDVNVDRICAAGRGVARAVAGELAVPHGQHQLARAALWLQG